MHVNTVCVSQDGGVDFSPRSAQELRTAVQGPDGRLPDRPRPQSSAWLADAGAAQRGQAAVGLPGKTDSQGGPSAEESRAAEHGGAELKEGRDGQRLRGCHESRPFYFPKMCTW